MKSRRKKVWGLGLASIAMAFVLTVSTAVPSLARTFEKDSLEVTVTTDKESYSVGDEILVSVTVRNTGTESINNIKVKLLIPDCVTLAEGMSKTVSIEALAAGEEKTAKVPAKIEEDVNGNGNISGDVETGDTHNAVIYIVVISLVAAAFVGFAFAKRKNNKAAEIISAIVVTLAGVTVAMQSTYASSARGSFEVSQTIKVDGQEQTITAVVTYGAEESTEAIEETESTEVTEPTNPTEETESTKPTNPTEETESTEPTNPTEETESTEPTNPTEETEPTEPTNPTEETEPTEPTNPTEETEPTEPEVNEPTTATALVTGTAYPDKESEITVKFTADNPFTSKPVIKLNGTDVSADSVVGMMTVNSITYSGNECTVSLKMSAINGWNSVNGSYDVELVNGNTTLASENVSYSLDLAPDTDYAAILPSTNSKIKAYYKFAGTKMYVMTVLKGTIHCKGIAAGGTTYEWWNGVSSQIYVIIDGTEYSVGSYVFDSMYAKGIDWSLSNHTVNFDLINADESKATRSYMALGTFDNDTDTDTGCILLNVVDLSLAGYTADLLNGKTISFCGYIGPNDNTGRFEAVVGSETYTIVNGISD